MTGTDRKSAFPAKEAPMSFRFFDPWNRVLEPGFLARLGRKAGLVRRKPRKMSATVVFWSLVSCMEAGGGRSMAAVARAASRLTGRRVSRQAARKRVGAAGLFMRRAFEKLVRRYAALAARPLPSELAAFEDATVVDSTSLAVVDRLARLFPACRTNVRRGALKIHARMSLRSGEVERLRISAETVHDLRSGLFGRWVRGRLLLFDLGYFDYGLFDAIVAEGGHFLTRLKASADGVIVGTRSGCARRNVDLRLNDAVPLGRLVDVDVRFRYGVVLRVVGDWNEETGCHHWYVTNLAPAAFPPEEIRRLYALRWQVELLFKEWKSLCGLRTIRAADAGAVVAMTYAALCISVLARIALALSCRRHDLDPRCGSDYEAVLILRHMVGQLARDSPRRGPPLRRTLDEMLTAMAIHAVQPGRTTALTSHANACR